MALSSWPGTVNQFVNRDGYGQQPERNVATFQPDVGPPMQRRRSGISTDVVSFASRGTPTEWANLMTFYRTTLHDGVDQFTRNHPLSGASNTICQFMEAPALNGVGALYYHYTIKLRIFS